MRDLRDPQKIGEALADLRSAVVEFPLSVLAAGLEDYDIPDYDSNPSCIDKYGRPDELEPVFMEVRVK